MALIKCNECGKEMSDTVKKCPHCGYTNKYLKQDKVNNGKNFIKQHIKVISIIVIVLVVGVVVFTVYNKKIEQNRIQAEIQANTLTDDEKIGAKAVNILKSNLKNQDSLNVYEIWYRKTQTSAEQVLIDYSAQNGFGGSNRNVAMVENDKFWGSDSKADNKITKYTKQDEMVEILMAQGIHSLWDSKGSESAPFTQLNKDKILRNLDKVN